MIKYDGMIVGNTNQKLYFTQSSFTRSYFGYCLARCSFNKHRSCTTKIPALRAFSAAASCMTPSCILLIEGPADPQVPLVLDSPHSGREFPADFDPAVSLFDLRDGEDCYVDELFMEPA